MSKIISSEEMEHQVADAVEDPLSKATEELDATKDRLASALKDWQDKVQKVEMYQSEETPSTLDALETKYTNDELQNHVDETKERVVGAVRDWAK
mmetsp:Transcript_16453/g.33217  ORF Transcript_16453/g.33217 Transcript_16453/m.33217 type:complete len:95 (+) Transcript_16453:144-428(+)|eukprot:scaffold44835_cov221-Amphora_coffeaeformis.AAC.1